VYELIIGYTDSGSDLGHILQQQGENVITPSANPSPSDDKSWTFPDTKAGINDALDKGANVLYANTVLHSQHAIVQMRNELAKRGIRMVGQSPLKTEEVDDKASTNAWLAKQPGLEGSFPIATIVKEGYTEAELRGAWDTLAIGQPKVMIVKPIRGRGSHGVSLVKSYEELRTAVNALLQESRAILLEVSAVSLDRSLTILGILHRGGDYRNCPTSRELLRPRQERGPLGFTGHSPNRS
jgi:D-alanine-D-alanine ligase